MIGFDNIKDNLADLKDFSLKWRFTDENYNLLPDIHLDQIKPLNKKASNFLWNYTVSLDLHKNIPFKKDFFKSIDKAKILENNDSDIKKWLYNRGLPFDKEVYLSWQPDEGMIVPWKILIKYFDDFYYSGSDDLTVFDNSLNWALLFYHESEIYFGSNEKYNPSTDFENSEFIW